MLAAIVVTVGGIFLVTVTFKLASSYWLAAFLVWLLTPLVRVIGDALNPDVPNPHGWDGYLRRLLGLTLMLPLLFAALATVVPLLALGFGLLYAALMALVSLMGLLLFVAQSWLGLEIARPIPLEEAQDAMKVLGFALLGGLVGVPLLGSLNLLKGQVLEQIYRLMDALRPLFEDPLKHLDEPE
jgi:hypothetical protein